MSWMDFYSTENGIKQCFLLFRTLFYIKIKQNPQLKTLGALNSDKYLTVGGVWIC